MLCHDLLIELSCWDFAPSFDAFESSSAAFLVLSLARDRGRGLALCQHGAKCLHTSKNSCKRLILMVKCTTLYQKLRLRSSSGPKKKTLTERRWLNFEISNKDFAYEVVEDQKHNSNGN